MFRPSTCPENRDRYTWKRFLPPVYDEYSPANLGFGIRTFQGKDALLRKLESRLRGYSAWMPPDYRIVVLVDRDETKCETLKSELEDICGKAGLRSKRVAGSADWQVVTRIAIEELEAWYFSDWDAVRKAYPRVSHATPRQARYRNPDRIKGGTWEAFERILQRHGYFKQGLTKVQAATDVGRHFDPTTDRSHSFTMFRDAIVEATQ